ncbi:hypothetical protein [Azospirillum baldaniorum]|nr:hypothetical protein [Azospirillum baldaniorum]
MRGAAAAGGQAQRALCRKIEALCLFLYQKVYMWRSVSDRHPVRFKKAERLR